MPFFSLTCSARQERSRKRNLTPFLHVINDSNAPASIVPPGAGADCGCGEAGLIGNASGVSAGGPSGAVGGVRPYDGTMSMTSTDLWTGGFGGSRQSRSWGTDPGLNAPGLNGTGTLSPQLPTLRKDSVGTIVFTSGANSARYFDPVSGAFQSRAFLQEQLTYDSIADRYTLLDTAGDSLVFFGFGTSLPDRKSTRLNSSHSS